MMDINIIKENFLFLHDFPSQSQFTKLNTKGKVSESNIKGFFTQIYLFLSLLFPIIMFMINILKEVLMK